MQRWWKRLVLVEVLALEEAAFRSRLSDRFKSCGQAPRDRLVQLVKHEQPHRDSFFLEEKRHRGGRPTWRFELSQLTKIEKIEIFYFLKVSD